VKIHIVACTYVENVMRSNDRENASKRIFNL